MHLYTLPSPSLIINNSEELITTNTAPMAIQEEPPLLTADDGSSWTDVFSESSGFSVGGHGTPRPNSPLHAPASEIMKNGVDSL